MFMEEKRLFLSIYARYRAKTAIPPILIFSNDPRECKSMFQFIISPLSFNLTFFKDNKWVKTLKNSKNAHSGPMRATILWFFNIFDPINGFHGSKNMIYVLKYPFIQVQVRKILINMAMLRKVPRQIEHRYWNKWHTYGGWVNACALAASALSRGISSFFQCGISWSINSHPKRECIQPRSRIAVI